MVLEGYHIPATTVKHSKHHPTTTITRQRRANKAVNKTDVLKVAASKKRVAGDAISDTTSSVADGGASAYPLPSAASATNSAPAAATTGDEEEDEPASDEEYPEEGLGRFACNKLAQDQLLADKLTLHAANRQQEALQMQISSLEDTIQIERGLRQAEANGFYMTKEGLLQAQKASQTEINRLAGKVSDMEKVMVGMADDLQVAQSAAKFSGLVSHPYCLCLCLWHGI